MSDPLDFSNISSLDSCIHSNATLTSTTGPPFRQSLHGISAGIRILLPPYIPNCDLTRTPSAFLDNQLLSWPSSAPAKAFVSAFPPSGMSSKTRSEAFVQLSTSLPICWIPQARKARTAAPRRAW